MEKLRLKRASDLATVCKIQVLSLWYCIVSISKKKNRNPTLLKKLIFPTKSSFIGWVYMQYSKTFLIESIFCFNLILGLRLLGSRYKSGSTALNYNYLIDKC